MKQVRLHFHELPDLKVEITAALTAEGDLRVEDYAIGERMKGLFDGDLDYERIVIVKAEEKDALLLSLLQERFSGNSAFSEFQDYLAKNKIKNDSWSG